MTNAEVVREYVAAHEMIRRLGFSADHIFMEITPDPLGQKNKRAVSLLLKSQGKQFRWNLASVEEKQVTYLGVEYTAASERWNRGDDAVNEALLRSTQAWTLKVGLVQALLGKGFLLNVGGS